MLNRGFFSLQSPWIPSWVALGNLGVNAVLDAVFYRFGIWGIPLSTSLVNIAGTAALLVFFRRRMRRVRAQRDGSELRASCPWRRRCSPRWRGASGTCSTRGSANHCRRRSSRSAPGSSLGYAAFFGACRLLGVRELETLLRLGAVRA